MLKFALLLVALYACSSSTSTSEPTDAATEDTALVDDASDASTCGWDAYGHACDLPDGKDTFGTCCAPLQCVPDGNATQGVFGRPAGGVPRCN
jgi:hypothetical protein